MSRMQHLNHKIILDTAITYADKNGIDSLSMRSLGRALEVEAMAIYHHFSNKQQLIEAMIGVVHAEFIMPYDNQEWRAYMKARAQSVIETMSRHPWASGLMESGIDPTEETMVDRENIARCLRMSGFSVETSVHVMTLLDIYIYGGAQQYIALSFESTKQSADISKHVEEKFSSKEYPYFSEILTKYISAGKYSPLDEFYVGFETILDCIERLRIVQKKDINRE